VELGGPQRRQAIRIRLDPAVLRWFKVLGPGTRRGSTRCCGLSWRRGEGKQGDSRDAGVAD
jgi:hypothetical protein